jgi:hypothetical protein
LSKNKWEVDICLLIVIIITHRRLSIINNGGGLKLTPQGIPGHLVWGVEQTSGGFNPPAIQTLTVIGKKSVCRQIIFYRLTIFIFQSSVAVNYFLASFDATTTKNWNDCSGKNDDEQENCDQDYGDPKITVRTQFKKKYSENNHRDQQL